MQFVSCWDLNFCWKKIIFGLIMTINKKIFSIPKVCLGATFSWAHLYLHSNKLIRQIHLPPSLPLCHSLPTEITVLPLSFSQKPVQGPGTNLTVTWAEGPLTEHGGLWDKYWALSDAARGEKAEVGSTHLKSIFFYLTMEIFSKRDLNPGLQNYIDNFRWS